MLTIEDIAPVAPKADAPTEKQIAYFETLANKALEDNAPEYILAMKQGEGWTKKNLSKAIDALKNTLEDFAAFKAQQAKAQPKPAAAEVEEGIYMVEGTVYKVQTSRGGNRYAKQLIVGEKGEWDYVGRKPFRHLGEANKLSLEAAQEFGKTHGVCAVCGAHLTAENSMEAGIGPVCAGRL